MGEDVEEPRHMRSYGPSRTILVVSQFQPQRHSLLYISYATKCMDSNGSNSSNCSSLLANASSAVDRKCGLPSG